MDVPSNSSSTSSVRWTELKCEVIDKIVDAQGEAYWVQVDGFYFALSYSLVCSFGALANLFVLIVFATSTNLRTVRNYFILNLACSDLLLCLFTAPATAYLGVNLFWPLGSLSCQILASVQALNTFVSSLTLALIALDRVLLTLSPMKWRLASTAPLVCYVVLWFISLLVALPYSMAVHAVPVSSFEPWTDSSFNASISACNRVRPLICQERSSSWIYISKLSYTLTVLAIQYLLPLFALGFAYTQIGSTIRKRGKKSTTVDEGRRVSMQHKNRKAMILLVVLVATYALSWAPVNLYNVLSGLNVIEFSQYRYLFCHIVGISSACINPITYALVNDAFRDAASLLLFSKCRSSRWSSQSKRTQLLRREIEGTTKMTNNKRDTSLIVASHADSLL